MANKKDKQPTQHTQWMVTPSWLSSLADLGDIVGSDVQAVLSVGSEVASFASFINEQPGINNTLSAATAANSSAISSAVSEQAITNNRISSLATDLEQTNTAIDSASSAASLADLATLSQAKSYADSVASSYTGSESDVRASITNGLSSGVASVASMATSVAAENTAAIASNKSNTDSSVAMLGSQIAAVSTVANNAVTDNELTEAMNITSSQATTNAASMVASLSTSQATTNELLRLSVSEATTTTASVASLVGSLSTEAASNVKTVNNISPDIGGNVDIDIVTSFSELDGSPTDNASMSAVIQSLANNGVAELSSSVSALSSAANSNASNISELSSTVSSLSSVAVTQNDLDAVSSSAGSKIASMATDLLSTSSAATSAGRLASQVQAQHDRDQEANDSAIASMAVLVADVPDLIEAATSGNAAILESLADVTSDTASNTESIASLSTSVDLAISEAASTAVTSATSAANSYTDSVVADITLPDFPEGLAGVLESLQNSQSAQVGINDSLSASLSGVAMDVASASSAYIDLSDNVDAIASTHSSDINELNLTIQTQASETASAIASESAARTSDIAALTSVVSSQDTRLTNVEDAISDITPATSGGTPVLEVVLNPLTNDNTKNMSTGLVLIPVQEASRVVTISVLGQRTTPLSAGNGYTAIAPKAVKDEGLWKLVLNQSRTILNSKLSSQLVSLYRTAFSNARSAPFNGTKRTMLNLNDGHNFVNRNLATVPIFFGSNNGAGPGTEWVQGLRTISGNPWVAGDSLSELVGWDIYPDGENPLTLFVNGEELTDTSGLTVEGGYWIVNGETDYITHVPIVLVFGDYTGTDTTTTIRVNATLDLMVAPIIRVIDGVISSNVFVTSQIILSQYVNSDRLNALESDNLAIDMF